MIHVHRLIAVVLLVALASACRGSRAPVADATLLAQARAQAHDARACLDGARRLAEQGSVEDAARVEAIGRQRLSAAEIALESFLSRHPHHAEALGLRGLVGEAADDSFLAASCYRRALDGGAGREAAEGLRRVAVALHARARASFGAADENRHRTLERYRVALAALADEVPPREVPEPARETAIEMVCEYGANLLLARRYQDAETMYLAALDLEPRCARAYEGLGQLARRLHWRSESFRQFHRALIVDPRSIAALSGLFNLLMEEGRVEEAVRYLERLQTVTEGAGKAVPRSPRVGSGSPCPPAPGPSLSASR